MRRAVRQVAAFPQRAFSLTSTGEQKGGNPTEARIFQLKRNRIYDPFFDNSLHGPRPRTKAGGRSLVSLIPGIGVGPELMQCLDEVFQCAGAPVDFEWLETSLDDETEFENMILSIRRNGVGIKGNLEERKKSGPGATMSKNMIVRRILDLYVNVMECKPFPGLSHVARAVKSFDITIIRQNTEGEYALLEHNPLPFVVENLKMVTKFNTIRLANYAYNYAIRKGRKKISVAHNSQVNPLSEGLFLDVFEKEASKHPQIMTEFIEVETAVRRFIVNPRNLDVLVCNSLYGGIFAAMLFGLLGGPALIAGHNVGQRYVLFEPAARNKGSALVGKGTANPTAVLMCGVAALEELGHPRHAEAIRVAINKTMLEDRVYTRDLGGRASTKEFVKNIIERIKDITPAIVCAADEPPRGAKPPSAAPTSLAYRPRPAYKATKTPKKK